MGLALNRVYPNGVGPQQGLHRGRPGSVGGRGALKWAGELTGSAGGRAPALQLLRLLRFRHRGLRRR